MMKDQSNVTSLCPWAILGWQVIDSHAIWMQRERNRSVCLAQLQEDMAEFLAHFGESSVAFPGAGSVSRFGMHQLNKQKIPPTSLQVYWCSYMVILNIKSRPQLQAVIAEME